MTNRERIIKTCVYDFLLGIASRTDACVIRLSCGTMPSVKRCNAYKCCAACLQKWLNEEEKQNGKAE